MSPHPALDHGFEENMYSLWGCFCPVVILEAGVHADSYQCKQAATPTGSGTGAEGHPRFPQVSIGNVALANTEEMATVL